MLKRRIQDRISALPDRVLLHILSFLNMKEVVRTSVLSKRWQYTWTSVSTLTFVSTLIFRYHQNYEKTAKFVAWVNKTLLRCRNTIIEKFTVNFTYNDRFVHDVDVWASFAAQKKVRDLSLHLESDLSSSIHMSYSLPQSVCCNSFLMNLSIRGCKVVPKEGLSWTSLKSLSIEGMELNDDTIAKILSGSPMLEYLKITHCEGFNRLDIKSETLRELVIDGYLTMLKDEPLLEISAPNLQSLHILGYLRKFRLMSVPSLLKAELNFSFDGNDEYEKQCSYFIELLESLRHVEELEVGHWCIQLLSVSEVKGFPSPSSCRKCLKLEANIDKLDLPGIISLLKSSPYLEKLVIKSPLITDEDETIHTEIPSCSHFLNRLKKYWSSEERDLNFAFLHLRIVEFNGFTSLEDPRFILKLIQLLLQNAGVLKSILISMREYDEKCSSCLVSPDLLKLAQELLSFERLSPHAKIIFS